MSGKTLVKHNFNNYFVAIKETGLLIFILKKSIRPSDLASM